MRLTWRWPAVGENGSDAQEDEEVDHNRNPPDDPPARRYSPLGDLGGVRLGSKRTKVGGDVTNQARWVTPPLTAGVRTVAVSERRSLAESKIKTEGEE